MTDAITLLRTISGARLTKLWKNDGTIAGYENAKTFKHSRRAVADLHALSEILQLLRTKPDIAAIRGSYPAGTGPVVERNTESTRDEPHHWMMVDVDDYEPLCADPLGDPAAAAAEFILDKLPSQFQGAAFYWQLSSSAGAPGKAHLLKAHLWFWLSAPAGSVALRQWAKQTPGVDASVYRQVQLHYTADPVFEAPDLAPASAVRAGLVDGGEVDLSFLGDIRPISVQADVSEEIDLGALRGPLPDYDLGRVEDEVLAHLDPGMPYDDWLQVGMALHHQFDGSDEALELWDTWSSDGATWPRAGVPSTGPASELTGPPAQ